MNFDKKILKKCLAILTLCLFCITIYRISKTYSLLETNVTGEIQQAIAKWNIELNETDITNGISEDIIIDDFEISQSSHVKSGKIAPGINGTIDLTLDPKDTDVSVRYDLTLHDLEDQPVTISSVEIISGSGTLIRTDENTYTGLMNLSNIKSNTAAVTVRIRVYWENSEENNDRDTEIGTQSGYQLEIPVKVSVKQYLGEEITPYVEGGD